MPLYDPLPPALYIDKAGRLVLPKSLRQRLRITPDTPLELVHKGDAVLLRRVEERPVMQQVDGLWVHQGTPEPSASWADPVEQLRDERADDAVAAGAPENSNAKADANAHADADADVNANANANADEARPASRVARSAGRTRSTGQA